MGQFLSPALHQLTSLTMKHAPPLVYLRLQIKGQLSLTSSTPTAPHSSSREMSCSLSLLSPPLLVKSIHLTQSIFTRAPLLTLSHILHPVLLPPPFSSDISTQGAC